MDFEGVRKDISESRCRMCGCRRCVLWGGKRESDRANRGGGEGKAGKEEREAAANGGGEGGEGGEGGKASGYDVQKIDPR